MMGAGSLVPQLWKGMDFEFVDFVTNTQGSPFGMLPLMCYEFYLAFMGLIWRAHRRLLAVESLRPVSPPAAGAGNDDGIRLGLCAAGVFLRCGRGGLHVTGRPTDLAPVWTVSLVVPPGVESTSGGRYPRFDASMNAIDETHRHADQ
jgi:hypothetical protein